jgi:hypothetical protein
MKQEDVQLLGPIKMLVRLENYRRVSQPSTERTCERGSSSKASCPTPAQSKALIAPRLALSASASPASTFTSSPSSACCPVGVNFVLNKEIEADEESHDSAKCWILLKAGIGGFVVAEQFGREAKRVGSRLIAEDEAN